MVSLVTQALGARVLVAQAQDMVVVLAPQPQLRRQDPRLANRHLRTLICLASVYPSTLGFAPSSHSPNRHKWQ